MTTAWTDVGENPYQSWGQENDKESHNASFENDLMASRGYVEAKLEFSIRVRSRSSMWAHDSYPIIYKQNQNS